MQIVKRGIAAAIAASFTLTSSKGAFAQTPLQKLGKPEGQVDIVAWPGYIERGETDKAYDCVCPTQSVTFSEMQTVLGDRFVERSDNLSARLCARTLNICCR